MQCITTGWDKKHRINYAIENIECHLNMQMKLQELEFSQKKQNSDNIMSIVTKSNPKLCDDPKLPELQVYISATGPDFNC